jgi:hypothetical protein
MDSIMVKHVSPINDVYITKSYIYRLLSVNMNYKWNSYLISSQNTVARSLT